MRIFVGGLLPARQEQVRAWFPHVKFEFASDQDSDRRWLARALRADIVIIDQGRTTHKIVDRLKSKRISCQFADGNAAIRKLIETTMEKHNGQA